MTRLSVNINKVALVRNSRENGLPDLVQFAQDCERMGAEGITVHPRPDERHIRYSDVPVLKKVVKTELNVEGNPTEDFMHLVKEVQPHQVTLVPDNPNQLTSDHGWDVIEHQDFLKDIIADLKQLGIRVSIFIDPDFNLMQAAKSTGTDAIELYTEPFASKYGTDSNRIIKDYILAANKAKELDLLINAGHDLNLKNLAYFKQNIPFLDEVSIGHALVVDAWYFGLENTIQMYKRCLV